MYIKKYIQLIHNLHNNCVEKIQRCYETTNSKQSITINEYLQVINPLMMHLKVYKVQPVVVLNST